VPFDPFEQLAVGDTGVRVTRVGFGTAPIGGLYAGVTDAEGEAVSQHAWDIGVRYFDTAPLYGFGLAEERLGRVLARQPRDAYALSTKVGRLIRPASGDALEETGNFQGTRDERPVWDFSRDGVHRSIEESLRRLGVDRIDIVFIHDPDDHWRPAIEEAYPALHDLRAQGVIRAIGAGMNQSAMLTRFVQEGDMDILLVAGRYTILDQEALVELLPLCQQKGVVIVIGGIMNSGILADPRPGAPFNYRPASDALVSKAQAIRAVCERHGVSIKDAAIQFPFAHPAVVTVAAGVRTAAHLDDYPVSLRRPIPGALWEELRAEGLIAADAPVPA
jgi:D-threo-aldose 1-dehydrogenase